MPNGLDGTMEMLPSAHMAEGDQKTVGLSLLFHPGDRPDADAVERVIATARENGLFANVTLRPQGEATWLEILASGLTFDLLGLEPGDSTRVREPIQRFGFENDLALDGLEAIELIPSGHIIAGAGLQPVVRVMMGLAANITLGLPTARAVAWGPANTLMEPGYFCRMVLNWLGGGAFPALGLTALLPAQDGSLASRGLAHFTGHEMQLEGRADEPRADTAKLAVRVIDHFVRNGAVTQPLRIDAGTQVLIAEPSQVGKLVFVWREATG